MFNFTYVGRFTLEMSATKLYKRVNKIENLLKTSLICGCHDVIVSWWCRHCPLLEFNLNYCILAVPIIFFTNMPFSLYNLLHDFLSRLCYIVHHSGVVPCDL